MTDNVKHNITENYTNLKNNGEIGVLYNYYKYNAGG